MGTVEAQAPPLPPRHAPCARESADRPSCSSTSSPPHPRRQTPRVRAVEKRAWLRDPQVGKRLSCPPHFLQIVTQLRSRCHRVRMLRQPTTSLACVRTSPSSSCSLVIEMVAVRRWSHRGGCQSQSPTWRATSCAAAAAPSPAWACWATESGSTGHGCCALLVGARRD